MSQNRRPPAYQEYPAEILAKIPFRTMSLQDRGLFCTMRFECWVNSQLPKKPDVLAKVLGLPVDQVSASLPAVMPFFEIVGDFIICPELENYRKHLDDRAHKLSEAGKRGAAKTNEKSNIPISNDGSATPTATPQPPRRLGLGLLVQSSTEQQSKDKFSKGSNSITDPFVKEMEEYEIAEESRVRGDETEYVRV